MLKKIKLKNSTILLIGMLFILSGVIIGFVEYFNERKDKMFSEMNIKLYANEQPENIENDEIVNDEEDIVVDDDEPNIEPPTDTPTENPGHQNHESKYDFIGILEIPKINLKRGFLDLSSKYNDVKYNITVINGSTYPDFENNNLILAAHSGVCSVCYFNKLYKLSVNDEAYVYYKNIKYYYKIVNIYDVEKDGTVAIYRDYNKNTLTLITCTRNSDTKQTVYILELINKENY